MSFFQKMGLIASICLPLWNIPLIWRILKRKSSKDLSLAWLMGVWVCSLLIVPSGLMSDDIILKIFSVVNIILFTGVVVVAIKYRK